MTRNSEEMTLELCDPQDSRLSLGILQGTLNNIWDTKPIRALVCPDKVQKTMRKVTARAQAGLH